MNSGLYKILPTNYSFTNHGYCYRLDGYQNGGIKFNANADKFLAFELGSQLFYDTLSRTLLTIITTAQMVGLWYIKHKYGSHEYSWNNPWNWSVT